MNADFAAQITSGSVYVAERDGGILGYVVCFPEDDHIHLENLAVWPELSGRGVGRKLLEFVEKCTRERGLAAIELYTNEAMSENLSMYIRLGYRETSRKLQDGFSRVFFRKDL